MSMASLGQSVSRMSAVKSQFDIFLKKVTNEGRDYPWQTLKKQEFPHNVQNLK